jgi:hypothetical protein
MNYLDRLTNPSFARQPLIRLNARTLGIVLAFVSLPTLLGLVGWAGLLLQILLTGGKGILSLAIIGLLVTSVGAGLAYEGGWRIHGANPTGKRLVVYGLTLAFLGQLCFGLADELLGGALSILVVIVLLVLAGLYYLVVTALPTSTRRDRGADPRRVGQD